jgi:hypothetical protein
MNVLEELDLAITFNGSVVPPLKFDQQDPKHVEYHDLVNMPRVDFVVELKEDIYFIELKDTNRPDAADLGGATFMKKIANGKLEQSLAEKYLYTFIFRWAENQLSKRVHYVCLITLEDPIVNILADDLAKTLRHLQKPSKRWSRQPLTSCQVHSLQSWEETYPNWPIRRLSDVVA